MAKKSCWKCGVPAFQITGPGAERWKQFLGPKLSWKGKNYSMGMNPNAWMCVFWGLGRDGGCFGFPVIPRMVRLASNGRLQFGTKTQVCIPMVVDFRISFPYYLKQVGAGSSPSPAIFRTKMPYLTDSEPDRSYWQASSQPIFALAGLCYGS